MKNIRPLILDTTFILPLFGVQITVLEGSQEILKDIWNNKIEGYKVYLPSICLIEVMFKLLSEYRKSLNYNMLDRYRIILPTILTLPLEIINSELNTEASLIATKIRHSGHSDFMDCWIAGTTTALDGILLSEDKELKKILKKVPETKNLVVVSWTDFIKEIIEKKQI